MKNKKQYCKPEFKQVNLVPEESVLTNCKSTANPINKQAGPQNCGTANNACKTPGT